VSLVGPNERIVPPMAAWLYVDEVTHRALNDFAILSALVRRAASKVEDAATREALDDVMRHLHTVASTLHVLKPPRDNATRDLNSDLEELCGALSTLIASEKPVRLTLLSEPVTLSAVHSWKICLVIAELVMNAARHAFRSASSGEIIVDMSIHDGTLRCAILDNGYAGAVVAAGRGSAILDAIAAELDGVIGRTHTARGSAIVLHVPIWRPSNDA
jgi:two-component system, sensor histidine kinase PdtaS